MQTVESDEDEVFAALDGRIFYHEPRTEFVFQLGGTGERDSATVDPTENALHTGFIIREMQTQLSAEDAAVGETSLNVVFNNKRHLVPGPSGRTRRHTQVAGHLRVVIPKRVLDDTPQGRIGHRIAAIAPRQPLGIGQISEEIEVVFIVLFLLKRRSAVVPVVVVENIDSSRPLFVPIQRHAPQEQQAHRGRIPRAARSNA